jgi:Kef-type K+ transport system membrane component KefB
MVLPDFLYIGQLDSANVILIIGIIVTLGAIVSHLFRYLHVPQVVGYIFIGIVLGGSGLRILGADAIDSFFPISGIALTFIGFSIGAELKASTLKKHGRQFSGILFFEAVTPFFIVSLAIGALYYAFSNDIVLSVSIATILGAISAATAPAATTDVLKENRARGPLTTTILGIVALDEAAAVFLYIIASFFAHKMTGGAGFKLSAALAALLGQIIASLALGIAGGFLISFLSKLSRRDDGRTLTFTLGILFLVCALSAHFGLNGILTAMAAGFFISNFSPANNKNIFSLADKFTPPIYVLFFVLAGAQFDVSIVSGVLVLVFIVYITGRVLGKTLGSKAGALLSKSPLTVRRYLPYCLLSQARVAIGIALAAGIEFPGVLGRSIIMIVTVTAFVTQIVGPIFVKYGITKAGECGLDITYADLMKNCTLKEVSRMGEGVCSLESKAIVNENERVTDIVTNFGATRNLNYAVKNDEGILTGVITLDHLRNALTITDILDFILAIDIMETPLAVVHPNDSLERVFGAFDRCGAAFLPIADENGAAMGVAERTALEHYLHERVLLAHLAPKASE